MTHGIASPLTTWPDSLRLPAIIDQSTSLSEIEFLLLLLFK